MTLQPFNDHDARIRRIAAARMRTAMDRYVIPTDLATLADLPGTDVVIVGPDVHDDPRWQRVIGRVEQVYSDAPVTVRVRVHRSSFGPGESIYLPLTSIRRLPTYCGSPDPSDPFDGSRHCYRDEGHDGYHANQGNAWPVVSESEQRLMDGNR